jgi:hypothetical protein
MSYRFFRNTSHKRWGRVRIPHQELIWFGPVFIIRTKERKR